MFSSGSSFGQTSMATPLGSQVGFGQTNNAQSRPFGSSIPFGSSPGSLVFGGTSTGAFGQPSTTSFGVSTSASGFGPSPSFSSGSTQFGQNASFGGFGSTPSGSTLQPTKPTLGNNAFGSTNPFGTLNQPTFGLTSTPGSATTSTSAFGSTTIPTFGATTNPASGTTNSSAFGSTTTSLFGGTGNTFGVSSTSGFSSTSIGSSTPFGVSTPSFTQTPVPPGCLPSAFGTQSSSFGAQTNAFTFGSQGLGQGSRVAKYSSTAMTEQINGKVSTLSLQSMSAMPVCDNKSHEQLRWEDYERGDKGSSSFAGQPAKNHSSSTISFGQSNTNPSPNPMHTISPLKTNSFSPTNPLGHTSTNTFSNPVPTTAPNPFERTSTYPYLNPGAPIAPNPFGQTNTNPVPNSTPTMSPSNTNPFSPTIPFGQNSVNPTFNPASVIPPNSSGHTTMNPLPNPVPMNTASPVGQTSVTPTSNLEPTISPFGPNPFSPTIPFGQNSINPTFNPASVIPPNSFGHTTMNPLPNPVPMNTASPVGQTSVTPTSNISPFGPNPFSPTIPFGQNSINPTFNPVSVIPQNSFGHTTMNPPPNPVPMNTASPVGQTSVTPTSSVAPSISTIGSTGLASATTSNPWGTLPALPQMFPGHLGSAPSVQHGISRMPVAEKSTSIRISTLSAPRHLSRRRISLPVGKYNAKIDGPKIPFFMDDEETKKSLKADLLFTPRENPRLLVIRPIEQWPPRQPVPKDMKNPSESASPDENGHSRKEADLSDNTISKHREGEAAIAYSADFEPLMPKLCHADYYTEPRVQELAVKERAEPGFCSHVKDFVVGRHGYGSIKFDGETDVRRLDIESIVQFNNKEVIVYKNASKKPPVGQGLNKAAEVTLLNVKCINKKTGQHYTEGQRVDKFKDMLMKKTEEQGAEFVFFDAVKGLWKFKVQHF